MAASADPNRSILSRRAFLAAAAGGAVLPAFAPFGNDAAARGRLSSGVIEGTGASAALNGIDALDPRDRSDAPPEPNLLRDYSGRLCYNENPIGPSPAAIAAMTQALPMGHLYPDWYAESLRSALASVHGISSSYIIAGCGGTEMLRLAALAFAEPGRNVVSPYPSYSQFPSDCSFLGAEVRYAALDASHRVDLAAVSALVDANTTAVALTNPNNPTATVLGADSIAAFAAALPSSTVLVIDEAYHEYVNDPGYRSAVELIGQGREVVVIRTFSKVFGMAGIRVGYAVGRSSPISRMRAWQTFATVSRPALDGAIAALGDTQHIADTTGLNAEARAYGFAAFDLMGLPYIPSQTNFFMVDVGSGAQVASELAARGIQVRTGWSMPAHIRVSTGTMADMQAFITELADILGTTGVAEGSGDGSAEGSAGGASGGSADGAIGGSRGGEASGSVPKTTLLGGNHPNPFARETRIEYLLSRGGEVRLEVFDVHGRRIRTLASGAHAPGRYAAAWDGTTDAGLPAVSGSYFCRLTEAGDAQVRRLILAR